MNGSERSGESAALSSHRQALREHLIGVGFAASGAAAGARLLVEFDGWLAAEAIAASDVTEEVIDGFVAARRASGRSGPVTRRGLDSIVGYLRGVGVIPAASVLSGDAVAELVAAYGEYMRVQRRLAPITVHNNAGVVRRFLAGREDKADLRTLDVAEVHRVVLGVADRLSPGATRAFVGALRPFLRFLFATGRLSHDLSGAVPSVAGSRLASLPKAADPTAVQVLLGSCDRTTPVGRRDYAILVLLSRMGLRAAEVAAMRLDDIDWRAGQVLVRGKGDRLEQLPLPGDVGAAVAGYLRHGRPRSASRAVFLRVAPPVAAMTPNAVLFVPRTRSARLGLGVIGAHRLRHSAATAMLGAGASLREVGQVLRHRDDVTTSIYAKVDRGALDLVVRVWPEPAR